MPCSGLVAPWYYSADVGVVCLQSRLVLVVWHTLPYLTLPHLTLPYLTLPYLTLPYLTLPYLTFWVGGEMTPSPSEPKPFVGGEIAKTTDPQPVGA